MDGLARVANDVTAIHIDDLAWHHSSFNWGQLLIDHILTPLRRNGPPISYRPDAWVVPTDQERSASLPGRGW